MKKFIVSVVTSTGSVIRVYFDTFKECRYFVEDLDNPRAFYIKYNSNPKKHEKDY